VVTIADERRVEAETLAARLLSSPAPDDPWAIYRRLQELAPVVRTGDVVVATSYAHVNEVLRDASFGQGPPEWNRTRQLPRFPTSRYLQAVSASLVMVDPPEHTRLRRVLAKAFTPRATAAVEPFVRRRVDELVADIAGRSSVDLKADFAARLPIAVIGHLVGFPEDDHDRLAGWGHLLEFASSPVVPDDQLAQADQAAADLEEYTSRLFADRSARPRDDVLSDLVAATKADGLSRQEFATQLLALVVAGTQTTTHLITSGVVALHEKPAQLQRLRADPSLDERAIEELLRYYPPLHTCFPRLALNDTSLGGLTLRRKDKVLPVVAAANRDPAVFDRPDELVLDRDPSSPAQLSFGHGAHLCIGRALARLEGRIAIRALLDAFPNLSIDPGAVEPWATAMARGHARVPATLH
jgi:cytochrome P450